LLRQKFNRFDEFSCTGAPRATLPNGYTFEVRDFNDVVEEVEYTGTLENCEGLMARAYFADRDEEEEILDENIASLGRDSWVTFDGVKRTCKLYDRLSDCNSLRRSRSKDFNITSVQYCNFFT